MAYGGSVDPRKVNQINISSTNDDYSYSGIARANAESLGLDPSQFTGNVYAQRKGYELSGADLQKANIDWELSQRSANLEYDLSKKMFDETQSWQAQVEQMREAGINPLFGITGGNTTGGADAPNVAAPETSNIASAVQGAQVKSQAMLGVGQVAVDAFRQAMSVPMMAEQVRGMHLKNNLDESLQGYYFREQVAKTEKVEADSRQSTIDAVIADLTKGDKISQIKNETSLSDLKVQAEKNHLDIQQFEKYALEFENKIKEIDAKYKEVLVQNSISIQAYQMALMDSEIAKNGAAVKEIMSEISKIKAETIKIGHECNLLQKEEDTYQDRFFMSAMNVFNGYVNAMSAKAHVGIMAGMKGVGANAGAEYERVGNAIGSALETIKMKFGGTGSYVSFSGDDHYQGITPNSRGVSPNAQDAWTMEYSPRQLRRAADAWDRAAYEERFDYQRGRIKPEDLKYVGQSNPYRHR